MLHLSHSINLRRRARLINACCAMMLCAVCLIITGATTTARAQNSGQGNKTGPRRPLPKPAGGSRGFEQSGDASSRLISAGATRGEPRLKAIAPMEGLAYDAHPFFKWTAMAGAKSYRFVLREANSASAPILFQTEIATPQLLYPANAPALQPGKLYTWRVSTAGKLERKSAPPVNFFILAGEDAAEVRRALEQAKVVAPKTTDEHIRQAQVFERYGVWYDALRDANEAVNANPKDTAAKDYYEALLKRLEDAEKPKDEGEEQ